MCDGRGHKNGSGFAHATREGHRQFVRISHQRADLWPALAKGPLADRRPPPGGVDHLAGAHGGGILRGADPDLDRDRLFPVRLALVGLSGTDADRRHLGLRPGRPGVPQKPPDAGRLGGAGVPAGGADAVLRRHQSADVPFRDERRRRDGLDGLRLPAVRDAGGLEHLSHHRPGGTGVRHAFGAGDLSRRAGRPVPDSVQFLSRRHVAADAGGGGWRPSPA